MKEVFTIRDTLGKYIRKPKIRDILLKIVMMCDHIQIRSFCHHQHLLLDMLQSNSPYILELMEMCLKTYKNPDGGPIYM